MATGDKKSVVMGADIGQAGGPAALLHANQHASGGADPITPDMIGAVPISIFSGDLNELTTPGMYRLYSVTNSPTLADYGNCLVLGKDGEDTLTQIIGCYTSTQSGSIKFREGQKISGVWNWGAWKTVAHTDYAVNKAGDTMTGNLTLNKAGEVIVNLLSTTTGRFMRMRHDGAGNFVFQNSADDGYAQNSTLLGLRNETNDLTRILCLMRSINGSLTEYTVFHTGNKPTGSYTGNATARTIDTGGIGSFAFVRNGAYFGILCGSSLLYLSYSTMAWSLDTGSYITDGVITLSADSPLNTSAEYAVYQLL